MTTQQLVAEWRKKQTIDEDDPLICCVPYGGERHISDCEKRRGENDPYYNAKDLGAKTPKAKFVSCVKCIVWQTLPPQTITKHPLRMVQRKDRSRGVVNE